MAYTVPSHDPATGTKIPPSWGDEVNANFLVLNSAEDHIFLHSYVGISDITTPVTGQYRHVTASGIDPEIDILGFDDSSDEGIGYNYYLPADYSSSPKLKISYMMAESNTSKSVRFVAQVCALSDGDDRRAAAFDSENAITISVPDAADEEDSFEIELTNDDNMVAESRLVIFIWRDADHVDDDAIGDFRVTGLKFCYERS